MFQSNVLWVCFVKLRRTCCEGYGNDHHNMKSVPFFSCFPNHPNSRICLHVSVKKLIVCQVDSLGALLARIKFVRLLYTVLGVLGRQEAEPEARKELRPDSELHKALTSCSEQLVIMRTTIAHGIPSGNMALLFFHQNKWNFDLDSQKFVTGYNMSSMSLQIHPNWDLSPLPINAFCLPLFQDMPKSNHERRLLLIMMILSNVYELFAKFIAMHHFTLLWYFEVSLISCMGKPKNL